MSAEAKLTPHQFFDRNIEENPQRPGAAEARLSLPDVAIPVWALAGHYRVIGDDVTQLAPDDEIPVEAARVAVMFYLAHQVMIGARLCENDRLVTVG